MKTHSKAKIAGRNGVASEVLTLAEAAAFLRVPKEEVLRLIREQELPARQLGSEWRFLKIAIQQWLSQPVLNKMPAGIWSAAGSWQNDPYLDDMLKEIYRGRGRPMNEEG